MMRETRLAMRPSAGSTRRLHPRHQGKVVGRKRVDFAIINDAARANLLLILKRWLPGGQKWGSEYVAFNPRRADRHLGSFRINLRTGRWADFATDDKGGDVISLAAFLFGLSQIEAARRLADMLGITDG